MSKEIKAPVLTIPNVNQKANFNLKEISEWGNKTFVTLPSVQRGFVWKASQIETLWDSILRGYPIGAFVLSPKNTDQYEILDGQQRATSICLGFNNETFRDSQENIRIFIDLALPQHEDSRKFVFRVITRSHPWGYRYYDNTKPLDSESIRKAMDIYDVIDPMQADLDCFFPYDASFPVPFHFFTDAAANKSSLKDLITKLQKWQHWKSCYKSYIEENEWLNSDDVLSGNISLIYEATKEALDIDVGQKIPVLYMNLNKFLNTEEIDDENSADEIENIFVRLNAGGTQLSGEELNYSILKAHFNPSTPKLLEEKCKRLFKPSRFITVAFRLYQARPENTSSVVLNMRIKPKQFQKTIASDLKEFEKFIIDLCVEQIEEQNTLLEYTEGLLAYKSGVTDYGLPYLIYSKISDHAPELMFLLLYRIKFIGDRFERNSKKTIDEHKKALGLITLLSWFGKGYNNKDHSKLLGNVWPVANFPQVRFWSHEIVQRARLREVLLPFPNYLTNEEEPGLNILLSPKGIKEKTDILLKIDSKYTYRNFLNNAIYNKNLLLYAQRSFIDNYFKIEHYTLEDTNIPFDWDHIYPQKLIQGKKNLPQVLRDWYQTNGNFRAWPYSLNRMDNAKNPGTKLRPLNKNNFENVSEKANAHEKWNKFIEKHNHLINNVKELDGNLLDWSFCGPEWASSFINDIKSEWRPVVTNIVVRNIQILQEWYLELEIDKLNSTNPFELEDILHLPAWRTLPIGKEEIDKVFESKDKKAFLSKPFTINGSKIHFYFNYPIGDSVFLETEKIEFGMYRAEGIDFVAKIKDKIVEDIDLQNYTWIQKMFTLLTTSKDSIERLISEMNKWLKQLPIESKIKTELTDTLQRHILKKYRIN